MTIKEIQKSLNPFTRFNLSNTLNYLPKVLREGEEILAFTSGTLKKTLLNTTPSLGILVGTNERIFFLNKEILKVELKEFTYEEIESLKKENFFLKSSFIFSLKKGGEFVVQQIPLKSASPFLEEVKEKITSI